MILKFEKVMMLCSSFFSEKDIFLIPYYTTLSLKQLKWLFILVVLLIPLWTFLQIFSS